MIDRAWRPVTGDESACAKRENARARQLVLALLVVGCGAFLEQLALFLLIDSRQDDVARFEGGTHAEPGHQKRVRVYLRGEGWITAAYDRVLCRFMALAKLAGGRWWYELDASRVVAWTQLPPGHGFSNPQIHTRLAGGVNLAHGLNLVT